MDVDGDEPLVITQWQQMTQWEQVDRGSALNVRFCSNFLQVANRASRHARHAFSAPYDEPRLP